MNRITITGFVNNKTYYDFDISYFVKKNNEFNKVIIKAKKLKKLNIKNNSEYVFQGFLTSYTVLKENSKIIKPLIIVQKVLPVNKEKKFSNKIINLKCKIIKLSKLDSGNTFGTIVFKNNKNEDAYISFIGLKDLILPLHKIITINGFLNGDIWYDKKNIKHNKPKLFISEII